MPRVPELRRDERLFVERESRVTSLRLVESDSREP